MNRRGARGPMLGVSTLALLTGLCAVVPLWAGSDRCLLPAQHAGMSFPVDRVDPAWTCRLHPIMTNYTTANMIGPVRVWLPDVMYVYLLDHPSSAAALINRLDIGLYRAEQRGPGQYWGYDGEGTEGIVELVYHDPSNRLYYLSGSHVSRVLPHLTGKAVVWLHMTPVQESAGVAGIETTMVAYTRIDNRVWSGIGSMLRPLVGGAVNRKLVKAVEAVNRLSRVMRDQPDRVLFEAADPPALPEQDAAFLKQHLDVQPLADPDHPLSQAP